MTSTAVSTRRILVVDDDAGIRESLAAALEDQGWEVEAAATGEAALARLKATRVDVIVLDERMPGLSGLDVLRELVRQQIDVPVLFLTAYGDEDLLRELLDLGVGAYCDKPFQLDRLIGKLRALLDRDVPPGPPALQALRSPIPGLIGRSPAMQVIYEQIRRFAAAGLNVLITGETGVGKERVARAIHALSSRASAPFLSINCANLEPALLESELFGHAAGAFTDAKRARRGLFVEADGGIAFLDEVVELPATCQAKLLKAIQDKEVRPIGGTRATRVDVRFVAACNEDIRDVIRRGRFREDLYHRLAVGTIHVPPLRERLDDLPDLAVHILARLAESSRQKMRRLTSGAMRKLLAYSWPGNVRELENVLELAMAYTDGEAIDAVHVCLPKAEGTENTRRCLDDVVQAAERAHILQILRATDWAKGQAAGVLGIARTTLNRKIEQYRLDLEKGDPTPQTPRLGKPPRPASGLKWRA